MAGPRACGAGQGTAWEDAGKALLRRRTRIAHGFDLSEIKTRRRSSIRETCHRRTESPVFCRAGKMKSAGVTAPSVTVKMRRMKRRRGTRSPVRHFRTALSWHSPMR